jgi:hypothetical protein
MPIDVGLWVSGLEAGEFPPLGFLFGSPLGFDIRVFFPSSTVDCPFPMESFLQCCESHVTAKT